ncbi:hypothetical protein N7519_003332 [Penicillium mononematosum]|uniref:uncharacterized protein n=1 Tax=Penicillium mononematosum TaxID=268346 RepID=UPI002547C9C4|nr:uncharacterized protein N7519_003332 [Penicillium mononematosum]KAJ6188424.1 hypothetical protein N7519_003332 [Penicillium mononematosum]
MDTFLTGLTRQAMNYAIRSGIAITASYAMRQSSRLLKNVKSEDRDELVSLQQRLESKIQVIAPAIDMIELIAARGNTSLESAVALTKSLRWDIQALGQRLGKAAASEELRRKGASSPKDQANSEKEIKLIIKDIKKLLARIEDAVPLMNLAITTSGAKLSTNLPATVSPSRLLQASTFLTAGDTQYSMSPSQAVQVGPTFTLSMYMLFASHLRPHDEESVREATWKEVMHKARLKLRRVPIASLQSPGQRPRTKLPGPAGADEYAYQVLIIEDLDDGRVHTIDENDPQPQNYEGVSTAGIREILPIHQISKIFYADTGRILNISTEGETNNPVLLLKRDLNALPPRRMMEREEVEEDFPQAESEEEPEDEEQAQLDAQLNGEYNRETSSFDHLHEDSIPEEWRTFVSLPSPLNQSFLSAAAATTVSNPHFENIRTSLSLLETLLRLTSLQQFQQQSHLSISDELLNFFLEESSTTGAGGDEQHRQRLRSEARRRVGWDPYNESPVKHRGEDYQYGWEPGSPHQYGGDPYSPSGRPQGFHLRSRESTPETPVRKGSPNVRPVGQRGMRPAYTESPLSKKIGRSLDDGDVGSGRAD